MGGSSSKLKTKKEEGDPVETIMRQANREQLVRAVRDLPFPRGHGILRQFANALEAEYVLNRGPIVGEFLEQLDMSTLASSHVNLNDFIEWTQWIEALIKLSYHQGRNYITIEQLRSEWGLMTNGYGMSSAAQNSSFALQIATVAQGTATSYPGAQQTYAQAYAQAQAYPKSSSYDATPVAIAQPVNTPIATPVAIDVSRNYFVS